MGLSATQQLGHKAGYQPTLSSPAETEKHYETYWKSLWIGLILCVPINYIILPDFDWVLVGFFTEYESFGVYLRRLPHDVIFPALLTAGIISIICYIFDHIVWIGLFLGLPISYFFQPVLFRAELSFGDYLRVLPAIFKKFFYDFQSDIIFPIILTTLLVSIIALIVKHFVNKIESLSVVTKNIGKVVDSTPTNSIALHFSPDQNGILDGFRTKINADPLNIKIQYEYCEFLIKNSINDLAIESLYKLLTINQDCLEAKELLTTELLKITETDINIIIECSNSIIQKGTKDFSLLDRLADYFIDKESYSQAIVILDYITIIDANNLKTLIKKVKLCLKLNKYEESIIIFKSIFKIDSKNSLARLYLSIYLIEIKKFEDATKLLQNLSFNFEDRFEKLLLTLHKRWIKFKTKGLGIEDLNLIEKFDYKFFINARLEFKIKLIALYEELLDYKLSQKKFQECNNILSIIRAIDDHKNINDFRFKIYFENSKDLFTRKRFRDAKSELEKALSINPKHTGLKETIEEIDNSLRRKERKNTIFAASAFTIVLWIITISGIYLLSK